MNVRTQRVSRRTALKIAGVVGVSGLAGCVNGSGGLGGADDGSGRQGEGDFPNQDITLVIPYSPGGGYDTYTRLMSPYLEKHINHISSSSINVIPQNITGAGGQIGTEEVFDADPNGYTNQILSLHNFARQQIEKDVDYNLSEFTYYSRISEESRAIAVAKQTGIETFDDFVTSVENEELRFATAGPVASQVLIPSVIGEVSGQYPADKVRNNTVVYDGNSESVQGMETGDVDVLATTYSSLLPFIEGLDQVQMMMVIRAEENPPEQTPDAETLLSAGIEEEPARRIQNTVLSVRAFGGPPDISEERVDILRTTFERAIKDEEFISEAEEAERPVNFGDHETSKQIAVDKLDTWSELEHLLEA